MVAIRRPAVLIAALLWMPAALAAGADVNARTACGETQLHYAAFAKDRWFAQQLIKARSDLRAANTAGESPLFLGRTEGCSKSVASARRASGYKYRRFRDVSLNRCAKAGRNFFVDFKMRRQATRRNGAGSRSCR
jgi:hypothetical protein